MSQKSSLLQSAKSVSWVLTSDSKILLDLLYELRSPFNPTEVVAEIVALMRQYRCTKIFGDKYGAQWTVEAFATAGACRSWAGA